MLCCQCRVNCLFCTKKHALQNQNVSFVECTKSYCTHWSCLLPETTKNNKGCVIKSKKLMDTVTCLECNGSTEKCDGVNKTGDKLRNISKNGTYNELSKISVLANSDYHKGIYDAITSFKKDGKRFLT